MTRALPNTVRVARAISRGHITRSQIMTGIKMDPSTLTSTIQRLREAGWLASTPAREGQVARYRLLTDLATIEAEVMRERRPMDARALEAAWPIP